EDQVVDAEVRTALAEIDDGVAGDRELVDRLNGVVEVEHRAVGEGDVVPLEDLVVALEDDLGVGDGDTVAAQVTGIFVEDDLAAGDVEIVNGDVAVAGEGRGAAGLRVGGRVDGRAEIHVATGDCDRTAPDIDRLVERGGARTIHGQPAGGVDRAVENAVAGAGDHEPAGAGELPVHHDVARAVERDDAAVGGDGF